VSEKGDRVPRVVLYSRPGCHLCDVARDIVSAVRERVSFDFEEVDIERDDTLELEYGIRIPVVTVDGEERFEVSVDNAELTRLVREAGGHTSS
jgi:glutaredoxin